MCKLSDDDMRMVLRGFAEVIDSKVLYVCDTYKRMMAIQDIFFDHICECQPFVTEGGDALFTYKDAAVDRCSGFEADKIVFLCEFKLGMTKLLRQLMSCLALHDGYHGRIKIFCRSRDLEEQGFLLKHLRELGENFSP